MNVEAVLAKHEALLLRLSRIEDPAEFYDEVDTAAATFPEDLGLRDAIAKLALQDAGQEAADYVIGAWDRARKRKAEAEIFFKTLLILTMSTIRRQRRSRSIGRSGRGRTQGRNCGLPRRSWRGSKPETALAPKC
jgi:hypothetical protein